MTLELHAETQKLIRKVERKDRQFRIAATIFAIGIMLILAILLAIGLRNLSKANDQLVQQKQLLEQQQESTEKISRRLDCMTVFFSQKDRTGLSIANIDQCTLNRSGDIQRFFVQPQTGQSSQPQNASPNNSGNSTSSTPTTPSQPQEPSNPPSVVTPNPDPLHDLLQILPPALRPCVQLGNLKIC